MGSVVFVAVLGVGIVLMGWYFTNEDEAGDGDKGALSLIPDPSAHEDGATGPRYRTKSRSKPVTARNLNAPAPAKSYRVKGLSSTVLKADTPDEGA